ncbi:MAG: hypothetical protein VX874_24165 [Pseudomonadota bacterium]|nr:hypothetical protein [Pseudomonadota bacterium]
MEPKSLGPLTLFVERRFPLEMNVTLPEIRALYDSGKAGRWNPLRDVDWSELEADGYDAPVREAARRVWSRRAWLEATGLTETPALIVRLCMEIGREIDAKFYLTTRNTEEAWHVEAFDMIAEAFGGRFVAPSNAAHEEVYNRNLHRKVLDATQHLDAYVAAHAAFEDGLDLELAKAWRGAATNPAIAKLLDYVVADRERHAAFGWLYLESRAKDWTDEDRNKIADELVAYVNEVLLKGYQCPWLCEEDARAEAEAEELLVGTGLGVAGREVEAEVIQAYVANARTRLAEWGVDLPMIETNRMPAF